MIDLSLQGVIKVMDVAPTAVIIIVGAVIVASAHSAVTNKTATMSLSTADSQRHAGDSEVGVVADRRTAISPWDDSRQADTRRVSNVVITDTHIPMIVQ